MPSAARRRFKSKLLRDVEKLIETHGELNPAGRGRRNLGHITRSGVVMLCASWELYVETVIIEGLEFVIEGLDDPAGLPNKIKGKLAQAAKASKHEFGVLNLCSTGWKKVLLDAAKQDVLRLNTPKFGQVSELIGDWLGADPDALLASWRLDREDLNSFVSLRGEIAHNGADARYVRRDELLRLVEEIDWYSVDTDNFLCDHVRSISLRRRRPWTKVPVHH